MRRRIIANYLKKKARILPKPQWLSKLNSNTEISVIVPAYNEASFIKNLLVALNQQTLDKTKYEVIVVDNGSTDNTVVKIKTFQVNAKYPLYLISERLPGAGNARKTGIDEVVRRYLERSDYNQYYIAITDADTTPEPRWLESITKALQSKSESAAVSGTYHASDKIDAFVEKNVGLKNYFRKLSTVCDFLDKLVGQTRLRGPNTAFELECYAAAGGFKQPVNEDGSLAPRECFELSKSIRDRGYEIYHLDLSIIASQRRKLADLLNQSVSYQETDGDKKRFKSIRDSENRLLNLAMKNVSPTSWISYQRNTIQTIIKNVILAPLYPHPEKLNILQDFLGKEQAKQLKKDLASLDLKSLSIKWSPLVLTTLERKLEKHE